MRSTVRVILLGTGIVVFTGFATILSWAQEGYSHVRIVRLSFTEGVVTVQRPDVAEWAMAPANTPIQEGFKLSTAESGFAEVEFENSSTARLGQLSLLDFMQLALAPSGAKVNRMTLEQGYATFNVVPEGDDFYEVKAGNATLIPRAKSRFRVDYDQGMVQVKVFKGAVEILSPGGTGTLGKDTVLLVSPGADEPFQISQGITKDAWDEWVEQRENRVEMARNQAAPSPYSAAVPDLLYGWMDLMSYGNWYSLPGYGYGWCPMVDYGWAPFTMGRWCWYPGFGYVWIGAEPWGWLPYHYGSWIYDLAFGWCWLPGGFGYWSPGIVNWYEGPGWVGWSPRSPRAGGGQPNCPQPQGCTTTVSDGTVRQGLPVHPNRLPGVNPRDGRPVERPDVRPDRLGMLPGTPEAQPAMSRGARGSQPASGAVGGSGVTARPGQLAPGGAREGAIVYDSAEGQYVNRSDRRAAPEAPAVQTPSAVPATSGRVGRPGPRENYPELPASDSFGESMGFDGQPRSPRGGERSGWVGSESTDDSQENTSSGTWRGPARSNEPAASRSSSSRPAPSVSTRSDSGSRSSGASPSRSDQSSSSASRSDSGGARSSGGSSDRGSSSHSSGSSGSSWGGGGSHSSGSSGGGWGGGGSHSSGSSGGSSGGGGSHSSGGSSGGSHSSSSPRH
jgi:hypothetical protein